MDKIKVLFINNKKLIRELVLFFLIGCLNFAVDTGIYLLLSKVAGWDPVLAKVLSYPCGVINSFFWNSRFTFKQRMHYWSWGFAKFVLVNLVSYGVSLVAIYILANLYGLDELLSQLIATVFSFSVNYAGNKFLVFAEKKAKLESEAENKQRDDTNDGGGE